MARNVTDGSNLRFFSTDTNKYDFFSYLGNGFENNHSNFLLLFLANYCDKSLLKMKAFGFWYAESS